MKDPNRIELPLSKAKMVKFLIFSALFLFTGIWIIVRQPQSGNAVFNDAIVKNLAAAGGILMGLFGLYFFTKKLWDKRPAIVIDENGITNNSGAFSLGLIPWTEITVITEMVIQATMFSKQRYVVIGIRDPEYFITRQESPMKRRMLALNLKQSRVLISSNALAISHDELLALLQKNLLTHRIATRLYPPNEG